MDEVRQLKLKKTEMKNLKQLIETRKTKARLNMESELKSQFGVAETGGTLWLTHLGVAFMEVPPGNTAADVAKMLDDARTAAVTYGVI